MGGVIIIILRPEATWLLDRKIAAQTRVVVTVGHSSTRPWAVFRVNQSACVVGIFGRTRPVNHVGQAIEGIVLKRQVGVVWIIDEGKVAHVVVGIGGVAFGFAP